jgi:flagellar biosynthesis protein FliR
MISVSLPLPQLQMFFLIFLRVGSILMTMPIFKGKSIPVLFKAGLALAWRWQSAWLCFRS